MNGYLVFYLIVLYYTFFCNVLFTLFTVTVFSFFYMISKREIKGQLQHLNKFKSLAKSIQMIAIANVHKLSIYISSRDFALSLFAEIYNNWSSASITSGSYIYAFLIITSEKNCCGKLNSDILRSANSFIDYFLDSSKQLKLILLGWRSRRALIKYSSYFYRLFQRIGRVSFVLSYALGLALFYSFFDICRVMFSKFNKIFEQIPCMYEIVSYNLCFNAILQNRKTNFISELIFSSAMDGDVDFYQFYFFNLCLIVLDAAYDQMFSEFGCRAYSMEISYNNAAELLKSFTLIYNKFRQFAITNELLDLIGGSLETA